MAERLLSAALRRARMLAMLWALEGRRFPVPFLKMVRKVELSQLIEPQAL